MTKYIPKDRERSNLSCLSVGVGGVNDVANVLLKALVQHTVGFIKDEVGHAGDINA